MGLVGHFLPRAKPLSLPDHSFQDAVRSLGNCPYSGKYQVAEVAKKEAGARKVQLRAFI